MIGLRVRSPRAVLQAYRARPLSSGKAGKAGGTAGNAAGGAAGSAARPKIPNQATKKADEAASSSSSFMAITLASSAVGVAAAYAAQQAKKHPEEWTAKHPTFVSLARKFVDIPVVGPPAVAAQTAPAPTSADAQPTAAAEEAVDEVAEAAAETEAGAGPDAGVDTAADEGSGAEGGASETEAAAANAAEGKDKVETPSEAAAEGAADDAGGVAAVEGAGAGAGGEGSAADDISQAVAAAAADEAAVAADAKAAAEAEAAAAAEEAAEEEAAAAEAAAAAAAAAEAEAGALRGDLAELRDRAKRMRAEAVSGAAEEAEARVAALKADLETRALANLHELGEEELRERVVRLVTEMSDRTQWQALEQLQMVKRVEQQLADRNQAILDMHAEKADELRERELAEQRRHLERLAEEALADKADAAREERDRALDELEAESRAREEAAVEAARAELTQVLEAQRLEQAEERLGELQQLRQRVRALEQVLDSSADADRWSHGVHKLSAATLALSRTAEADTPLHGELRVLSDAASGDDLVQTALASLPARVRAAGAATTAQLRRRLDGVVPAARRAALAPSDTMAGHAAGHLFSALMLRPRGVVEGEGVDARLSQLEHHLERGDLAAAVAVAELMQGPEREPISGWLAAARDRLVLDQVITLVKTHAALLAASLR
eukprot:g3723.t1